MNCFFPQPTVKIITAADVEEEEDTIAPIGEAAAADPTVEIGSTAAVAAVEETGKAFT
jgi:hypothetical protein